MSNRHGAVKPILRGSKVHPGATAGPKPPKHTAHGRRRPRAAVRQGGRCCRHRRQPPDAARPTRCSIDSVLSRSERPHLPSRHRRLARTEGDNGGLRWSGPRRRACGCRRPRRHRAQAIGAFGSPGTFSRRCARSGTRWWNVSGALGSFGTVTHPNTQSHKVFVVCRAAAMPTFQRFRLSSRADGGVPSTRTVCDRRGSPGHEDPPESTAADEPATSGHRCPAPPDASTGRPFNSGDQPGAGTLAAFTRS